MWPYLLVWPPRWLGTLREPWAALEASPEEAMEVVMEVVMAAALVGPMVLEITMATVESEETTMTPGRAKGL